MHFSKGIVSAALVAVASATENYLGFNTGSTKDDGKIKTKADFLAEFKNAQILKNAPGKFNSVRLYTNIQGGTEADPISAFDAAIETQTKILLGIWASGTDSIDNELKALKAGYAKFGKKLAELVIGISIGSEDLYRNSEVGIKNKAGIGAEPEKIVEFIDEYRKSVKGTALEGVLVGHVDTWDVYPNASNKIVIDKCDFLGLDEYPFYETGKGNAIENSYNRFMTAFNAAKAAIGNKQIWVTETGWPHEGKTWDQAVPSIKNAKFYWDNVGCQVLFGKVPTFYYTQRDSNPDNDVKFGISPELSPTPLFDLTCPKTFAVGPSKGGSSSSNSTGSGSDSDSGSGSGSGSGSASGSGSGSGPSVTNVSPASSGSQTGSSPAATSSNANAGARTVNMLPAVFYAGIAIFAGAAALL